jgi:hypothetical protein
MTEGFLADKNAGGLRVSWWVEGPVVKSFWTGIRTSGKKQYYVTVDRCDSCGSLAWFADKPFE